MKAAALALIATLLAPAAMAQPIKPFGMQSLEQIQAAHRGKPFVLLVWSMDCEFCQASLDNVAKARTANPALDIVTVTTDPVADAALSAQVRARLLSLKLLGDSWSFGDESPERLHFAIDPAWHGEKPRSYWYDARGVRVAYSGLIKPAKLEQWQQKQPN